MTSESDFSRLDFDVTERRETDKEIMELIKQMFVELKQMREDARQMRQDLHLHIADEKAIIAHAFPNADPDGHRAAHDAWIRKAESQTKFWEDMRGSVAKWGAIGALGFIALAVWKLVLEGPK